jgi:hypothetical protein
MNGPFATSSLAASGLVRTGSGILVAVLLTAGADAASVTIYDNTTTTGSVLAVLKAAAGATVSWVPSGHQACSIGLYAVITGTTPSVCTVYG